MARFWASFRTCRDMALVALMLLNGLRSRETLALRLETLCLLDRSLFRHHRATTGISAANPHRFRHYAPSRTMPP